MSTKRRVDVFNANQQWVSTIFIYFVDQNNQDNIQAFRNSLKKSEIPVCGGYTFICLEPDNIDTSPVMITG